MNTISNYILSRKNRRLKVDVGRLQQWIKWSNETTITNAQKRNLLNKALSDPIYHRTLTHIKNMNQMRFMEKFTNHYKANRSEVPKIIKMLSTPRNINRITIMRAKNKNVENIIRQIMKPSNNLNRTKILVKAGRGGNGGNNGYSGKPGENVTIKVKTQGSHRYNFNYTSNNNNNNRPVVKSMNIIGGRGGRGGRPGFGGQGGEGVKIKL
jgi:hypothetical protein